MTRGTLYCIDDTSVFYSIEFNGDMYPEGHGDNILSALRYDVDNITDFKKLITSFNEKEFHYEEKLLYKANIKNFFEKDTINKLKVIDFSKDYFKRFFSDWIFIKNDSSEDILLINANSKKEFILKSFSTIRLKFGNINYYSFHYDKKFDFKKRNKYI